MPWTGAGRAAPTSNGFHDNACQTSSGSEPNLKQRRRQQAADQQSCDAGVRSDSPRLTKRSYVAKQFNSIHEPKQCSMCYYSVYQMRLERAPPSADALGPAFVHDPLPHFAVRRRPDFRWCIRSIAQVQVLAHAPFSCSVSPTEK